MTEEITLCKHEVISTGFCEPCEEEKLHNAKLGQSYDDKFASMKDKHIEDLEAKLEDETYRYKWLKSELRTNAKIIGEQQDQIAELTAALEKVEVMATHTGDVNIQRVAREALAAVQEKKR